ALLPPWLWLWIATYFLALPSHFTLAKQSWQSVAYSGSLEGAIGLGQSVLGLNAFLEIIPLLALLIGVVGLAFPRARANFLEKKYALKPSAATGGAIADIIGFLQQHDPTLQVKVNLASVSEYAFVYPLSFRHTGVAIFAPLVKLWRSDQPMAEAMLLHELAHHRQGDAFVVGAGSPFKAVVKRWFLLYLGLFVVPFALSALSLFITFWSELALLADAGISWSLMLPQLIPHVIGNALVLFFGAIVTTLSLLFWTLSLFVLPLAGLWCAEFNADQAAAQRSRPDMLKAISQLSDQPHWRKWLLSRLSHPPNNLRRWFLAHQQTEVALGMLLLIYPLAYLLRLVALSGHAILLGNFNLAENWAWGLKTIAPVWLAIALILALWPLCAGYWEKWLRKVAIAPRLKPMPYWISAGIVVVLVVLGYGQSV
ncbi:MAG: hypothetical protein WBC73_00480, partial [Phormidesmis sp.]